MGKFASLPASFESGESEKPFLCFTHRVVGGKKLQIPKHHGNESFHFVFGAEEREVGSRVDWRIRNPFSWWVWVVKDFRFG